MRGATGRLLPMMPLLVALTGCAGSPAAVMSDSPEQLKAESDWSICQAYGMNRLDKIKAEIDRRGLIPAATWPDLQAGKVGVGDSACAALIAWGPPTKSNQLVTAAGPSYQWVYEHFGSGESFLYLQNGTVTAIQN